MKTKHISVLVLLFLASISHLSHAAIPLNYYDTVDVTNAVTLRYSLHEIIDDHTRIPYTSSATDTWDVLEQADQDQDNSSRITTLYKNISYGKQGGGNSNYNREHTWPKSYGFPRDNSSNYPYTDMHHLFLADSGYNSSRSNKPFDDCDVSCGERVTIANDGRGADGPDSSNWTQGAYTAGRWEVWNGRKGDVARAMLYMAIRYEGGVHNITGVLEPDLELTDDRNLIASYNTGANEYVAYMGLKSVLLAWHVSDPVDDIERQHNEAVYAYQGNRNPFVDHPEWVACVFSDDCSTLGGDVDVTPPATPTGLSSIGGNQQINLVWNQNGENDLAGYHVYRSDLVNGPFVKINSAVVADPPYTNAGLSPNTLYHYQVTAVDHSGNESVPSMVVSASTDVAPVITAPNVWINEFHYDNSGSDRHEFIEVAGNAGINLSGWRLVAYNGNGGRHYKSVALSGTLPDQENGVGTYSVSFSGLQNGGADGIALVDNHDTVVQFISYEGRLTAIDGPAQGMTAEEISVSETSSTAQGYSLQLAGNGQAYQDFYWVMPAPNSRNGVNQNQSFTPSNIDTTTNSSDCLLQGCNYILDVQQSQWQRYDIRVENGSALQISITGGTGDADLYVRFGDQPGTREYDCRPYRWGNEESCTFNTPADGQWHIGLRGYEDAYGVELAIWVVE